MTEGPFGGPRPFISDTKTIIVLLGIDEPAPPNDIQISTEETINTTINKALIDKGANISISRSTVKLTVGENPTREQRETVGPGILHVQQFDIDTELEEISQDLINAVHNTVVEKMNELGYNIVGTKTTVV